MAGNGGRGREISGIVMMFATMLALALWPDPTNGQNVRGVLTGRVTFAGTAPAAKPIDMSSEAYCQESEARRGTKSSVVQVNVGAQNGLSDVVVQIKGVPAQASKAVPTEPAVLDQSGCLSRPEVVALRVGQPLSVRNSDNVLHNVHVMAKVNQAFNLGQPSAGLQSRRTFRAAEADIPVRCDIHDWMQAHIAVFDHSFFAVTGPDGSFSIDGLPAGEYELEARHPTLGTRTQRVRIGDAGTPVTIVFGAS